jgi:hypothetical protein
MSPSERTPSRPPSELASSEADAMTDDLRRSADAFRASDFVLTEIAKLQAAGEYTKHELGNLRTEVRDLRTEVRDR